ncbi:unnamed protein product [Ilex paraguariensis]|uniref:Uncharacterized protein n=1 Tax=Ilex paraguariensis TaxID=185542 RepID=A0ABC8SWN1_9AQUA
MANFCCSIETEPRTLNQGQLTHAREAAVDIVQKKEPKEASSVFVEGMKPVVAIKEMAQVMVLERDSLCNLDESNKKTNVIETACQCSCPSAVIDSPDEAKFKEPLSAPF